MKKALSIILCLAMLISVVPASVFAAPAAVETGDTAYESGEEQGTLSDDTCAITFDAGTSAEVTDMPENTQVSKNSTYVIPDTMPKREGYLFDGWVRSIDSSETVTSARIAQDTTFYAKWTKGGYLADFDNAGDTMNMSTGLITLADGAKLEVSQGNPETWALDTEKGEVFYTVKVAEGKNMDFFFRLYLPSSLYVHTSNIKEIIVAARTDAPTGSRYSKIYYNTKNEKGVNNGGLNESKTIKEIPLLVTGSIEDKIVTHFPSSSVTVASDWKDYISEIRVNYFSTDAACSTSSLYLDYIKVPGTPSVEYFDISAQSPVASYEKYDVSAFTSNSSDYVIKSVEWVGGDFVAENYFDGNTQYTVSIEVEAAEGKVLSDAPAAAVVNGVPATIVSDGETATITYTFPATDALIPIQVRVSTKDGVAAEINEAWGTLQLETAIRAQGGVVNETGVIWSIPEEYANMAIVDENGLVTAIYNCDALPVVATSKYDHKTTGTINIQITNQSDPLNVTFNKGTGETASKIPSAIQTKGYYTLPADTATSTRAGYSLKGWSKVLGGEIIKSDFITEDTTYYAVWGYSKVDQLNSASATAFTAANSDSTFTATYKSGTPNYTIVTPTNTDVSKGVVFYANRSGKKTLFSSTNRIVLDSFEYIEMRTTLAPTNIELTVGIATSDEDGNDATELESVTYAGDELAALVDFDGEWYSYKIPTADFSNWENYLEEIKLTFVKKDDEGIAVAMSSFNADFIKLVGRDIPVVDIEMDAPVAATEFENNLVAGHNGYEVSSVEWSPALLDDKYFAGNTEYTAQITLALDEGYVVFPKPALATVNGVEAEYSRANSNKTAILTYTFEKTEDVDFSLADITYHESNGATAITKTEKYIADSSVNVVDRVPENIPAYYRWLGWSFTDGGELITEDFVITENTDVYAVYEIIDHFDFNNEKDLSDDITVENASIEYDGKWAVVTPDGKASLNIRSLSLSGDDYDYLEITFDANRAERGETNKFTEDLVPEVVIADTLGEYSPVLESTESVVANNTLSRKYVYNLTGDNRVYNINSLAISPYEGTPVWAIASIKFVKNTSLTEDIAITDLAAPETWEAPDTEANINSSYAIKEITWTTDGAFTADGSFDGNTVYTAVVVIDTVPGYKIETETVTINGEEPDSIVKNDDGTLTAKVTYPETEALIDFELTVADDAISTAEGSVKLVAEFSADIPVKDVVWVITSNGDDGNSAVIDQNGVVKASYDGVVTVKATSIYDPTKTATATVTITNQIPYHVVHFDANTTGDVSGMPADAHVKYDYVLPNTPPVRDGFVFAGWIEKPGDTLTVTKTYVDADVTYYALWLSGLSLEFYNESVDSKLWTYNSAVQSPSYNEEEGTFTFVPANPISYINTADYDPLFCGKENTIVEVRLKISKAGEYQVCLWFESDDANGNVLGPSYNSNPDRFKSNAYQYVKYNFAEDTYKILQFDMSGMADWVEGYPTMVRFDFPSGYTDPDTIVTIDYIRVVSYETNEVEVTGIDVPVAKAIADTDAVAKDSSKYTVTNVAWKEDLLHDYYHDAATEYTVLVTVKGAPGYVMSSAPTKATINGKTATIGEYNGSTGELTIEYTFPATADVDTSEYNVVTLSSKNEASETVVAERVIFAGDTLTIDNVSVDEAPAGTRFIGWASTEDATTPNVAGTIAVTEDVTYYAVYEEITEFDYSNPYHRPGTEAKLGSALEFDGTYAVITPAHIQAASALATPVMNIDGKKFGKIELYFSATMTSTVGTTTYDNKFSAQLEPELKFSTMDSPSSFENTATLIGAERVSVNNRPMYKYTYDMTTNSAWNGSIASVYTNPYSNVTAASSVTKILYPAWGLAYIKFIENDEAPVAEFEVAAPETWEAPATADNVAVSDKFVVTELTWSPDAGDVFAALGTYKVNITYRAAAGYMITDVAATINGEEAAVVDNGDGTYTASYTFPATENLKEVEVVISGPTEIVDVGRYIELTGKTVAVDGSRLPITDVVWSIEEGMEYATISENGRVYPISDGTITVKATSVYDEYVSATYEITIENQKELFTVTFDKNTQSAVTGLPDPVMATGTFVPESYNMKRDDGFFLIGWSTDEDAVEPTESFTITEDTTLYAKWSAGYEWTFDDSSTAINKHSSKLVTFSDGIASYVTTPGGTSSDIVLAQSGLASLKIETEKHNKLIIRYSQEATASCVFYLQSGDGVNKSEWSEVAKVYQHGFGANAEGTYHTATFDLTSHKVWHDYPYVEQIRYDNQSGHTGTVKIDYIRLYNDERVVEFNANGGLFSLYGGEISSYKEIYNSGDSIKLPTAPVREGYELIGWAKATEDYNKLYNGKFTVTDSVTLYAIWAPVVTSDEVFISTDEDITVTVDIADEMVVGENQTIVVMITGDVNASGDEGVVLHFTDANGVPQAVVVSESIEEVIVYDLSGDGFEGTVTDVYLTLPTGTTEGVTVDKVGFTSAENANVLAGITESADTPTNSDVTTSIGGTDAEHPGHNSYPEYQEGQIIKGPSFNSTTNDSKTGSTPTRPKDEDIVFTSGNKKDPGNDKFPFVNTYDSRFIDVSYNHWFFDDVINSYELGFMNGVSDTLFDPHGTVTVAQAIAVAARIHSTYNGTNIPAHITGDAWYQRYVNYAKSKVMITDGQFADYNTPITREQIANLFVRVAPASWFTKINDFTTIPDMGENAAVLRLYNAGIMIGVDDEYNFNPTANITRAEFSAVINRIALINSRIKVELPEPEVEEVVEEVVEEAAAEGTVEETAEEAVDETPVELPVETPEVVEA